MKKIQERRIKEFNEFLDKMSESLDSAIEIEFIEKNDEQWYSEFIISEMKFFLLIKLIITPDISNDNKCYVCKFGTIQDGEKNFKKLKDNDTFRSLKVLSTVKKYLNLFLLEKNPNTLTFFGSDKHATRIKLYQLFADEIINNNDDYFNFYHFFREHPIFIICNNSFNILKIKDFYISLFNFYENV